MSRTNHALDGVERVVATARKKAKADGRGARRAGPSKLFEHRRDEGDDGDNYDRGDQ